MIKRLLTIHRPALIGLWTMFCLLSLSSAYAQTYELNVGERKTLPYPTPPAGYVDHIGTGRCTNKSDCIGVNGLQIYVYNYFTGTATVEIEYNYTYTGSDKRTHVGNATAYYSVKCKPTEVKLSKSTLELESGDEVELSYSTVPSGLEPEVEWKTTNKSVATLSSENQYNRETISNEKKIYVSAETAGTCVVKLGCNTGYPAPECTVTVVDNHWVKADVTGSVKKGTKVTLSSTKAGATIYYTTDGTEPSKSSTRYSSPIEINKDMTIKAKAYLGNQESKTSTFNYTVVSHLKGEIFKAKTIEGVELSFVVKSSYSGVCLEVSSGNTYTPAIDKNYSGKITIPYKVDDITVYYIGERAFYDCNITNVVFEENLYVSPKTIRKEAFRNCKKLKSVSFPHGISLETMAFYNCSALENIVFEGYTNYNYGATTDMFNSCNSLKEVYIKWGSVMNEIRDNCFSEQAYNNALLYVPENLMSKYQSTSGWKKFKNIVAIGSEPNKKLTITASPSGGEVSKGTVVYLTASSDGSNVSGCDIYYTLNGTTPTKSSTKYTSSGITINSNCTLKAIAYKSGYEDSEVLTATYTIKSTPKQKLTLSASPSGGQVSKGSIVTLTAKADGSIISGCDVYYTLNGTTPTKNSTKYTSSGITINSAYTLKAIAYKDGYETSDVGEWKYTIKDDIIAPTSIGVYPSSKTIKVGDTFTASYTLNPSNATTTVTWYSDNSSIASVSSSGLVTGKSAGTTYINAKTANGKEDWCKVTVEPTSKPKLVLSASPNGGTVSSGTNVYLTAKADGSTVSGCDIYYTLNGDKPSTSSTKYTSNGITITENCTLKAIAYKDGYETSDVLTEPYTIKDKTKLVVVASPSGGEVTKGTNVKLFVRDKNGNDLPGDIYYTLDGSTPSKSSTKYTSSGITINSDCTLKAIAHKSGYVDSEVLTATYTVPNDEKVYPISIYFYRDSVVLKPADCYKLACNTQYPSGTTLSQMVHSSLTWSSSNTSIATVSNGEVTAIKPGTAEITVKCDNNLTASCTIKVIESTEPQKWDIKQVSASFSISGHTMVLLTDGSLWACGNNHVGQLGDGTNIDAYSMRKVMDDVAFVSAGDEYTMIVKKNGSLWACGYNGHGQLGNGSSSSVGIPNYPTKVMDGVKSVVAGYWHTMILKTDGSLWACGYNQYGELGDGTTTDRKSPKKVMDNVASVSLGSNYTMILKTDGSLWACGINDCGQLGDGSTISCSMPKKVMDDVESVAAGCEHTIILKTDGSLWACGNNRHGQLGDGTISGFSTPNHLKKIMDDVASVSSGGYHTMIVKTDGSLWACGYNSSGQLGDGSTFDRNSPKKVMEDVSSVEAGYIHTMILKNDGSLWAFGDNYYGQLCDGTSGDRYIPVLISVNNKPKDFNIVITPSGYATFYSSKSAYTLPNGLSAQVVTSVSNNKITYKTIADGSIFGVVPKGTAVMLACDNKRSGTYTLMATESNTTYTGTNLLRGSDEATTTTGDGYHYKLSYGPTGTKWDDVLGWYWGAQNGAPFQIDGHKAWLVVPRSGTRAAGFTIEGESLDIEAIDHSPLTTDCYYDLQGRRLTGMQNVRPSKKGVYIRNGQKVVVK